MCGAQPHVRFTPESDAECVHWNVRLEARRSTDGASGSSLPSHSGIKLRVRHSLRNWGDGGVGSFGISDAITRRKATGSFWAAVTSAGLPKVCHGLPQKFLPVEAEAISNLINDAV
jgi:hypothetical protein